MNPEWLKKTAEEELARVLQQLPEPIREAAQECPVQIMMKPDPAQSEGWEADELLGLFEGCSRLDGMAEEPGGLPRISLFLEALFEEAEGDGQMFREEVKITYLHELGHYLGWDEDKVESLGL